MSVIADQITESEAIDLAVKVMQKRVEELKPAMRECETFGDGASHIAKREAGRYRRLLAAMQIIKRMKWHNV